MDTSLAEEVQQTMATLAPNRFFFMSPYRSFTTSGCFARFDEPAVNGDSPDSPFQQKLAALFADAKAQGIKNPVMVGAIPFDPRQPSDRVKLNAELRQAVVDHKQLGDKRRAAENGDIHARQPFYCTARSAARRRR